MTVSINTVVAGGGGSSGGTTDGSTVWGTVSTTTYTVLNSDADGVTKNLTHASGCAVTIPEGLTWSVGQRAEFYDDSGLATFTTSGAATLESLSGDFGSAGVGAKMVVECIATNAYKLYGEYGLNVQVLDATPNTDDTYEGQVISGRNAGATIAQWEVVYLDSSGTWRLADANGTGTYPARGLAIAAYVSTNAAKVLFNGVARNDAWNWTIGGDIYLSGTPGAMTQTAPSTSGDKVQKLGYALSADSMMVCIGSGEYLTVT